MTEFETPALRLVADHVESPQMDTQVEHAPAVAVRDADTAQSAYSSGTPRRSEFDMAPEVQPQAPHSLAAIIADYAAGLGAYREVGTIDLLHAACAVVLHHTMKRLAESGQPTLDTLKAHADTLYVVARIIRAFPDLRRRGGARRVRELPEYFARMIRELYGVELQEGETPKAPQPPEIELEDEDDLD